MNVVLPTSLDASWLVLLGLLGLVLQALVQAPGWSATAKRWVTIAVAGVLGTLYAVVVGAIDGVPTPVVDTLIQWITNVAIIVVVGQAVYGFLKPSLATLEAASSPGQES